ncbi:hypothetical protein GCM10009551_097380 [Nocardiopsis tropica]|uniref:hypothetical protein n=1 Tax=Tsukamurella strandjordii TaxID=147577 RepID=UPI0031CE4257
MSNEYESALAEHSSEIVSAAVDYAGSGVEDVFVYLSTEDMLFGDVFFRQHGEVVDTVGIQGVDTSGERQRALMSYIVAQLRLLVKAARDNDQPVPSEMRLRYDVRDDHLTSELRYGSLGLRSNESESDLVARWMQSERG